MNLTFPNSTATLIKLNPSTYPDAVRALLRFHALLGDIRELRGRWYQIKRDEKDDFSPPLEWWLMLGGGWEAFSYLFKANQKHKPHPCKHCGAAISISRKTYCNNDCKNAHRVKEKPLCKVCGIMVKKSSRAFCSRECVDKYKIGKPARIKLR